MVLCRLDRCASPKVSKPPRTRQDALAKAAVERTYRDVMSGVWDDRSQFHAYLARALFTYTGTPTWWPTPLV